MRISITAMIAASLMVPAALASTVYMQGKQVRQSAWYNGTPGNARVEPVSSQVWLDLHAGATADLGIRDYGFFIEDPQLNELVYGIANRLLANWPGTVPQLAILVQGDGSPLLYGASTTHSNEIIIRYGVLVHAESEDELAAVIAHELAHVLLEHSKTLDYKKSMASALETFESVSGIYATAEALRMDRETRNLSIDPSIEKDLLRSADQRMIADKLYGSVHASLFSRGNEQKADSLALDLLVAAGYSPQGLKMSLERMAHSHDLSTEVSNFFQASSKQLLEESLVLVQQYADAGDLQSAELRQFMDGSQEQLKRSALDFGKSAVIRFSARSHPVPAKRVEKFTDYLYEAYPRSVRRRMPDSTSAANFREGHIGQLVQHYTQANQALIASAAGEGEAAGQFIAVALTPPTAQDAYTRFAAFSLARDAGDRRQAQEHLRAMDAAQFVPVYAAVDMADYLAATEPSTELERLVSGHEARYGVVTGFYPAKIALARAADEPARVQQLAQQCFQAGRPDSPLIASCAQYSGVAPPEVAAAANPAKALGDLRNMFAPKK